MKGERAGIISTYFIGGFHATIHYALVAMMYLLHFMVFGLYLRLAGTSARRL